MKNTKFKEYLTTKESNLMEVAWQISALDDVPAVHKIVKNDKWKITHDLDTGKTTLHKNDKPMVNLVKRGTAFKGEADVFIKQHYIKESAYEPSKPCKSKPCSIKTKKSGDREASAHGLVIRNGSITKNGKEIGRADHDLKFGYHPMVKVKVHSNPKATKHFELDHKDLVSSILKHVADNHLTNEEVELNSGELNEAIKGKTIPMGHPNHPAANPTHPNHDKWLMARPQKKPTPPKTRLAKPIDTWDRKLHKALEKNLGGTFEHFESDPKHGHNENGHATVRVAVTHSYTHEDFGVNKGEVPDHASETYHVKVTRHPKHGYQVSHLAQSIGEAKDDYVKSNSNPGKERFHSIEQAHSYFGAKGGMESHGFYDASKYNNWVKKHVDPSHPKPEETWSGSEKSSSFKKFRARKLRESNDPHKVISDFLKKKEDNAKPFPNIPTPAERRKQLGLPDPLKKEELEILQTGLDESWSDEADRRKSEEYSLTESKMSQLYTDIQDRLERHVKKYKNRTMDADTLGMHCITAAKHIAKKHNLEHKHAQKFVNDYVNRELGS